MMKSVAEPRPGQRQQLAAPARQEPLPGVAIDPGHLRFQGHQRSSAMRRRSAPPAPRSRSTVAPAARAAIPGWLTRSKSSRPVRHMTTTTGVDLRTSRWSRPRWPGPAPGRPGRPRRPDQRRHRRAGSPCSLTRRVASRPGGPSARREPSLPSTTTRQSWTARPAVPGRREKSTGSPLPPGRVREAPQLSTTVGRIGDPGSRTMRRWRGPVDEVGP